MTDFIERKLVISKDYPGDGWVGERPKPKYHMASYNYAHDYVDYVNKEPNLWNEKFKAQGLHYKLQMRTINVIFWIDVNLENNILGTYQANGIRTTASTTGVVRIDIRKHHNNFDEIKHTIRHEITHAIAHQINGCPDNCHNEVWIEIAKEHNVRTDMY